jgi:type II secretory pathway component PulK
MLARPTIESPTRRESALKYISLWSATKVNINTAPRQVLESVFVFGGREKEIADEIILKRRIKPFASIDEFKKELFSYSDSINKCTGFIVTESSFFTVKLTAVSGIAKVSALIAVSKDRNQTKRVAIVAG